MYTQTKWLDRVIDSATGELVQEATDQSAKNFNNMETGISDVSVATALAMIAIHQSAD